MKLRKSKIFLCIIVTIFLYSSIPVFANTLDTLTHYNIDVQFNDKDKNLKVIETIKFTNTYGKELKDIVLHLYPDSYNSYDSLPSMGKLPYDTQQIVDEIKGDIDIENVVIDDKQINFTEDNQVLKIPLVKPLASNSVIEITITFTLKLPQGTNRMGYNNDVYSLTNWYPILSIYDPLEDNWDENPFNAVGESNYSDIANYNVTLHIPKDIVVASTGITSSEKIESNLKSVDIIAENARDFVVIMSKNYKVISKDVDGVKVNSYYLSEDSKDNNEKKAARILDVTVDALKFFSETFGKYPYPELDVMETYLTGGAMEYPQIIQMGKYYPSNEEMPSGYTPWDEVAAVHETGHQWWYVGVGSNEFLEPLLDESLTQYSTAYYFEKRYGKYHDQAIISTLRGRLYPGSISNLPINSSVDKFKDWGEYSYVIYSKGQVVFEDLRSQVGDEKFIEILKTYYNRFLYKNASVDDLLKVIEEVAGKSTSIVIKDAMNSPNYYPKHLELTQEERQILQREQFKKEFISREKNLGITMSSIILRGIQGEDIYIVKPTNLSSVEKQNVDSIISEFSLNLEREFGVKPILKDDKSLTAKEKSSNNLIVFGNLSSKINKEMGSRFPMSVTSKGLSMSDISIKSDDISGNFISQNPDNKSKLILVYFWTKQLNHYGINFYDTYQFMINIENKKQLQGRF
jgi:hypothetical protein